MATGIVVGKTIPAGDICSFPHSLFDSFNADSHLAVSVVPFPCFACRKKEMRNTGENGIIQLSYFFNG